jgi:Protein of unknown function (DUF3109)
MIIVQDKLLSDELVHEQFICNLNACKGACCWEGDFGAPLEPDEPAILERIFDDVRPFLSPAGIRAIEQQGKYVQLEEDGSLATTLVDNGPCAYMTLDGAGKAQCGIERAWRAGATDFQKPISCHLYPIRIEKNEAVGFEALNYDRWEICSAACTLGQKEQMPVYRFLKEAIIRKYGEAFYEELDAVAGFLQEEKA